MIGSDHIAKLFDNFLESSSTVRIFSPFIKEKSLEEVIKRVQTREVIIRWRLEDLIRGVSDLEIFELCENNNIKLYRHPNIHLKALVNDKGQCFMGSMNLTSRGIRIPDTNNFNYELATIVDSISFEDKLYFEQIKSESVLVTRQIYEEFKSQLGKVEKIQISYPDFDLSKHRPNKDFLLSALPMTSTIDTLYDIYYGHYSDNSEEQNCAVHDLALYQIPQGLDRTEFIQLLSERFFESLFIKSFLSVIDTQEGIYFGRCKEWIHSNCEDVPLPRRWEITSNIQILFHWIVELGKGKYKVDVPNHSERLRIILI